MALLARWIGVTEGQVWTLLFALLLAVLGIGGMANAIGGETTVVAAPPIDDAQPPTPTVSEEPSTEAPVPALPPAPDPNAGGSRAPIVVPNPGPVVEPAPPIAKPSGPPTDDQTARPVTGTVATFTPIGNSPAGIAVTASGRVLVATNGVAAGVVATVEIFAADGTFEASHKLTGVERVAGLAVNGDTAYVVSTAPTAAVIRLDTNTGESAELVQLPDLPPCVPVLQPEPCEDGLPGGIPEPVDVVVTVGLVLVSDVGQGVIFVVDNGSIAVWAKSFRPDPTVQGGPTGLAVGGNRLLAVVRTTGPAGDEASVVSIPITSDGLPGAARIVTTLASEDGPVDVVGVGSGFAVSLSAARVVARYSSAAVEIDRWGSGSLDTPTWLARADALLVTDSTARRVASIVL